jgi:hypothetical protein
MMVGSRAASIWLGSDERTKAASALAEWMTELDAGRVQQHQKKYGYLPTSRSLTGTSRTTTWLRSSMSGAGSRPRAGLWTHARLAVPKLLAC